jgi:soluble P-type ATPase
VLQGEGSAAATLAAADIVVPAVTDALDLLVKPLRLVASLRS